MYDLLFVYSIYLYFGKYSYLSHWKKCEINLINFPNDLIIKLINLILDFNLDNKYNNYSDYTYYNTGNNNEWNKNHDSDISNDKVNDTFHDDYIKNNEIISAKKIGKVIENVIKQSTVII